MNKAFRLIIGLFALTGTLAFAQLTAFQTGGRAVASQYGNWQRRTTNAIASGAQTIQLDQCFVEAGAGNQSAGGGKNIVPWATNAPIAIIDSNSEVVAVTAVSLPSAGSSTGCSVTATFSSAHGAGATVMSGSDGLMEAANDISGTGGLVTIDTSWAPALGTFGLGSGFTLGATGWPANVVVEDLRNAAGPRPTYWSWKPSAVTLISAPSAPTVNVTTGSLSSGQYRAMVAYVDCAGGVSAASTDSSQTASTTGLVITSPAATTGACGYLPYITAAGGGTGTEILAKAAIDSTICTLSTQETVVPACAIGANATITAANPSSTAKPMVEPNAFSTFALQPFGVVPEPFTTTYTFGIFTATATLNSSNADAAQFQVPAGFFNRLGATYDVCVKGATATQVASSLLNVNLTMSTQYGQSPVTVSSVAFPTNTQASAGTFGGCFQIQTSTTGSSGKFWAASDGAWQNGINTANTAGVTQEDVTAAQSSAIDLTKQLWVAVNLQAANANNITGPIINSVSIRQIN